MSTGPRVAAAPVSCPGLWGRAAASLAAINSRGVAVVVAFLLVALLSPEGGRIGVNGCNVKDNKFITYTNNEPGSYFGYTVVQHKNGDGTWVLVGAPRGQARAQPSLERPGALYKCHAIPPYNCFEVDLEITDGNEESPIDNIIELKDNQWLGVSLTRQPKDRDAYVTVCGHLSKNDYYIRTEPDNEYSDRYVNGICYTINWLLDVRTAVKMRPCLDQLQVNGSYAYHAHCQAGISATYSMDGEKLVLGAVGSYEWNGTVINADRNGANYRYTLADLTDWGMERKNVNEYIGYSVSTGKFMSATTEQGVTGAPRSKTIGKVFIYDLDTFQVYKELQGEMMGTYYGGSVLGADLNNDGLSDLLVGAPLYTDKLDEGRVYVYMNMGEGKLESLSFKLEGSNAAGARFGSTMAFLRDVNMDGFNDVAIGAPYEDDNTGAVYIYRGTRTGIQRMYSQRLAARELLPGIKTFGSSLAGGLDVDFNLYPDIVVGAYANNSAYLFKTLPVVKLRVWIEVAPESLDPDFNNCQLEGRKITCLTVGACFDYTDEFGLPDEIKFDYNLEADLLKTDLGASPRFFFLNEGGYQASSVAATVELMKNKAYCDRRFVYLEREARDHLTPLRFLLNYNIFAYPDEPPPRGDTTDSPFAGGLAPVLDDSFCSNGTAEKTVLFISDCGNDSICQTDLRVQADLSVSSGKPYITLGGDGVVYMTATVHNLGEEAHQADLLITHAREVVFESLESSRIECTRGPTGAAMPCVPDNLITCEPREATNDTAAVYCSLGNPMRSHTVNILRLRFDVGGIAWGRRVVDFKVKATTLSLESNSTLHDNTVTSKMPVKIVADLAVRGVVQPEQLFYYADNKTVDGQEPDREALLRAALQSAGIVETEGDAVDERAIGPAFTHVYEFGNQGPGRLPFDTVITILLPWRTLKGDWLIYLRDIQLNGQGSCDAQRVLDLQRTQLKEQYTDQSGALTYSSSDGQITDKGSSSGDFDIGCENAACVTITCNVKGPLFAGQGAVINVDALLWQRTLIDNKLGSVDLVGTVTAALLDTSYPHTQPDNGMPDTIQMKTMVFTDQEPKKPVEAWIIVLSTLGGVLGLIILILALWKLGFFKRQQNPLDRAAENSL